MPNLITTNICATPATTYYNNPVWTSTVGASPICPPASYYTTVTYPSQSYTDIQTLCDGPCNSYSTACKAYVATESYNPGISAFDVKCFLLTTQAPAPTPCHNNEAPASVLAKYRDDVNSCFSKSVTNALSFCSRLLGRRDLAATYDYTTTTTPVITTTVTAYATKGVCFVGGGGRQIVGEDDLPAEQTPEAVAPTNPPQLPAPTLAPRLDQMLNEPRANPAPAPACLDAAAYPSWNVQSACSCLNTIRALTKRDVFTAAPTTKTVTKTVTTRVQKSTIPTFQPKVSVPGKQGGQFNLITRVVKDSSNQDRRIVMFGKPNDPSKGNVGMHVGLDQKMYVVTQGRNNLKPYGQLSFVTLEGGITVVGQLPDGKTGSDRGGAEFNSCVSPAAGPIFCKLKSGETAVFSQVEIPGLKNKFAVAVGKKALEGAKPISLIVTEWGNVTVGCGGKD
ncbi:uncharacterized protein B0I36DRAFT_354400 [Microdochium trichocladiopsis]|uniref:Uncharacterized protein n=1 Tax=Microdochium trichocladiopsis TaxID=1682393 RepID=A0A9P8XTZ4_9PEZI|nr:uncharacterized protein B0I36DRAFT_354400 [Microdochium trichocladiopsis]KAH7018084.1 hypothetical protein B0I36DRAFT_354400 [Microdochium trichocladiopsis]